MVMVLPTTPDRSTAAKTRDGSPWMVMVLPTTPDRSTRAKTRDGSPWIVMVLPALRERSTATKNQGRESYEPRPLAPRAESQYSIAFPIML